MAVRTYHTGDRAGGIPVARRRRTRPLNLTRYRCERIEALVEVLIGMLDALDETDDRDATADDDYCQAEDAVLMGFGNSGLAYPGDPDDAEPDEDLEASAQPAVTPDSTRPTLPLPVMVRA